MANERVLKFNTIVGNRPSGVNDRAAFWQQAKAQAALVLEEAQELYDAAEEENLIEYLDGWCDVRYTNDYVEHLLDAVGVQTGVAYDMVQGNNDFKYSCVEDFILQSQEELYTKQGVDTYISTAEYKGTTYYAIRRSSDDKVLKPLKHTPPQLELTIPSATLSTLSGELNDN